MVSKPGSIPGIPAKRIKRGRGMHKNITCEICGTSFLLDEQELRFYAEQKFVLPKRCPSCRKKQRDRREKLKAKKQEKLMYTGK
jgi:ssDNA-binding Zn-finger/Zn-ribbon topoisomerase 1